jgi:hypothetical protein
LWAAQPPEPSAVKAWQKAANRSVNVGAAAHAGHMAQPQQQVTDPDEIVGHLAESVRVGTDAGLRAGGAVMPPTVFILAEDMDQPFVGKIVVRRFYPGADAAAAIAGLGLLPSVLAATRLLVTYECQDLNGALGLPVDRDDAALVAVDARLTGHVAVIYPLRVTPGADWHRTGTVLPEWGTPARLPGAVLPGPVEQLLDLWRMWQEADLTEALNELDAAGYRMAWAER